MKKEFGDLVRTEEKNNSELKSIIGFYKNHFIVYTQIGWNKWYFSDWLYIEIGNFSDVINHMQQEKIIPYVLLYKVSEKLKSSSKVSSVMEEVKLASFNSKSRRSAADFEQGSNINSNKATNSYSSRMLAISPLTSSKNQELIGISLIISKVYENF